MYYKLKGNENFAYFRNFRTILILQNLCNVYRIAFIFLFFKKIIITLCVRISVLFNVY